MTPIGAPGRFAAINLAGLGGPHWEDAGRAVSMPRQRGAGWEDFYRESPDFHSQSSGLRAELSVADVAADG